MRPRRARECNDLLLLPEERAPLCPHRVARHGLAEEGCAEARRQKILAAVGRAVNRPARVLVLSPRGPLAPRGDDLKAAPLLAIALLWTACSSGASPAAALPTCAWPAALDDADAGRGGCHAARTWLTCEGGNVNESCLSNDPARCPGSEISGVSFTCHDRCAPGEYGVVCGAVGGGPFMDPPAGCHDQAPTPAGIAFHCCPCLPPR
jgi:hypothetical protein